MAVYIGDKNITDVVAGNALDSAKQYADQGDANTLQQAKDYTDSEVSQFEADYKQADATVLSEAKQYADQNMIPKSQKGQPGGLAELDETGRVPAGQLPGFVDDVINVDTYNDLPNPGEDSKIYITIDTNLQYRWGGKSYVPLGSSLALGTTSQTAGRGDWTQAAYNHSLITNGSNPHGTTFASLPDKPTSLPANGGNAESAVKDGNGNVIANSYLPLTGGKAITGSFTIAVGCKILEAEKNIIGRFVFGTDPNARTIIGAFDSDTMLISKSALKRNTNGTEYTIYDSGNLTKLSQLQDDVVSGNYFKLSANRVTNLNDTPINSFFVSSQGPANSPASSAFFVNGFCIAADNSSIFKKQLVYADDWYVRSQGNGSWGGWSKLWHAGNFDPSDKLGINDAAAAIKDTSDNSSKKIWTGTQAEYDAISTKDSNTIYFIV